MKVIIGGYAQGKLAYVTGRLPEGSFLVCDGRLPEKEEKEALKEGKKLLILNSFHKLVKENLKGGKNPALLVETLCREYPECYVISDEIGNGIVPMDAFEREYREQTGRLLIKLAAEADEVVRVLCGIGQRIK